jgi:hypothetical protein
MQISGNGWELQITRLGIQEFAAQKRTYGAYEAYRNGSLIANLSGNVCECPGPGENNVADTSMRIQQGRYPLWTQFGDRYRSIGYSTSEAEPLPMPGILLGDTGNRTSILIHPGHLPNLYLSSIGCLNLTGPLQADDLMNFVDSRARVVALIQDLKRFSPEVFAADVSQNIPNAWIVIDGEPMNPLPVAPAV